MAHRPSATGSISPGLSLRTGGRSTGGAFTRGLRTAGCRPKRGAARSRVRPGRLARSTLLTSPGPAPRTARGQDDARNALSGAGSSPAQRDDGRGEVDVLAAPDVVAAAAGGERPG